MTVASAGMLYLRAEGGDPLRRRGREVGVLLDGRVGGRPGLVETDAGLLRLFGHDVRHRDEGVRAPGGGLFHGNVEAVEPGALVRVKGQTVDGVDDGGEIFRAAFEFAFDRMARPAAEDAGFGGVGVDDVGPKLSQKLFELEVGGEVVPSGGWRGRSRSTTMTSHSGRRRVCSKRGALRAEGAGRWISVTLVPRRASKGAR